MSLDRRAPAPATAEEQEGFWQSVPHYRLFPFIGFLLGLGSPVGAFIMRYLLADPVLWKLWIRAELSYNALFYIYMGAGSVIAFVAFGYVIGVSSESERVRNRDLRHRVDDLHLKSVTDGLTGAYSHAYLRENLAIEVERADRHQHPLSVILLDIDDFKKINDTHGHLFGDRVLKELTETINMNIRQEDVLGRYGGEEFLVIMPGAPLEIAKRVAQRVCKAAERAGIVDPSLGNRPVRTTLSLGIATYDGGEKPDPAALVDYADKNLYKAKANGKNQVVA